VRAEPGARHALLQRTTTKGGMTPTTAGNLPRPPGLDWERNLADGKIRGLIQWLDHTSADGSTYCLKHLHPIDFDHELPASKKHAGVIVKVHVAFGLHTFTRPIKLHEPGAEHYSDNRETRYFCRDRYGHSHRLPEIVRELPTRRKIFFSRTITGLINYATFDLGSGAVYAVFFDVMLFNRLGPNTVLLTVESAYEFDSDHRETKDGRVSFNVIIGHALRGTKPHPPPRAR
jgi:hypothetical protein